MVTLLIASLTFLIGCLLLWVIVSLRGHWLLKLALILLTTTVAAYEIPSAQELIGLPRHVTMQSLNGKTGWLLDVIKQEPNAIYFVFQETGHQEPVLLQLPWTKADGKSAQDAKDAINKTHGPIHVRFGKGDKSDGAGKQHADGESDSGNGAPKNKHGSNGGSNSQESATAGIFILPPDVSIPKTQ